MLKPYYPTFIPLANSQQARVARQQGIIQQNELGFQGELDSAVTRLSKTAGKIAKAIDLLNEVSQEVEEADFPVIVGIRQSLFQVYGKVAR